MTFLLGFLFLAVFFLGLGATAAATTADSGTGSGTGAGTGSGTGAGTGAGADSATIGTGTGTGTGAALVSSRPFFASSPLLRLISLRLLGLAIYIGLLFWFIFLSIYF
jgi:hypothetical protein